MKKQVISAIFFIFSHGTIISQTQELIKVIPRPTNYDNSSMKIIMQKIDRFVLAESVSYVQFGNLPSIQKQGNISFSMPNIAQRIQAKIRKVESKNDKNYSLFAILGEGQGEMTLICENGLTYGSINYDDESYRIYGINKAISVIIKIDKNKLGKGDCEEPRGSRPSNFNNISDNTTFRVNPCVDNITRVLVLFTTAAQNEDPNIQQTINTSINNFNNAIFSSAVNESRAYLQLAGTQLLAFTERPSELAEDVKRLALNNDAVNARNTTLADIVVLLTKQGYSDLKPSGSEAFGMVRQIDAERDSAFAIVEAVNSASRNTFAHEVGHLFGGGHQSPTLDVRIKDYAHGRKFERSYGIFFKKRYATLMHTNPNGSNFSRVLAFSNPNVTYDGITTGDANCCNVARRIKETAPRIAAYNSNPNTLSGGVLGTNYIGEYGVFSFEPDITCGAAPYSFLWEVSLDGFNFTTMSSNPDGVIDLNVYPGSGISQSNSVTLRLTINSADNQQVTVFQNISVNLEGGSPAIKENPDLPSHSTSNKNSKTNLGDVYPNPVQNILNFDFYLSNESAIQIDLINLLGETITTIDNTKLSTGYYNRKVSTNDIPNGIYILRLKSDEGNFSKKITINH